MRPTIVSVLFIVFALFTSAEIVGRDDTTTTASAAYNYGTLSAILGSLASAISTASPAASSATPTQTTNLSNIAAPPANFIPVIMTAVPLSVLGDLLDSDSRSSMAADFQNGSTPAWYQSLPSSIKSYLTVVHSQIAEGALSANTSAAVATSSSTAMAVPGAPVPTGVMAVNMMGALGIAGLALAL